MRSFTALLLTGFLLIFGTSCDSADPLVDNDFSDTEAAAEVTPSEGAAKWDGCTADDPLCEVTFTQDGLIWVVTFEGFSYDPATDRTTYTYDIFMPDGASQSGKVAFEIPDCCTWSGELYSDGNKNDNAANDVEFNTSENGITTINYVFDGDLYIGPMAAGLKIQSNTNPVTQDIYGPAPWPTYVFTGNVFNDLYSLDAGPSGIYEDGEPGLDAVVTITTPNNTAVNVNTVGGIYSFEGRQGDYGVAVLEAFNDLLFTTTEYLPTTGLEGSVDLFEDTTGPNFGFMESLSISGGVFLDQPESNTDPGNGNWDPDEPGISGVAISLFDANGVEVASTFTDADGSYLFESLGWAQYEVRLLNEGGNGGFFTTAFTPTLPTGTYFSLFNGLVNEDKSGAFIGFEVDTQKAIKDLEDGLAVTTGLPREYWKVQVTGKGSPKYKIPDYSQDEVQDFLYQLDNFRAGGLPANLGLSGLTLEEATQIVKTENKNDIYEALRTEIFVALLNWAAGNDTVTIDGQPFETRFFIDHGIMLLINSGYPNVGAGKISSGSVSEGERLLEETNGG